MGGVLSNIGDSEEERQEEAEKFIDQTVRHAFMRKVFFTLFVQLIVTGVLMFAITMYEPMQRFVAENPLLLFVAAGIAMFVNIAIICCEKAAHSFPLNYFLLAVFTLAEAFLLGVLATKYDPDTILLALIITAAVCLGCIVFALQTKIDFTMCIGLCLVFTICLIVGTILMIFIKDRIMTVAFAIFGVAIYSFFLIMDIQLMMLGQHTYSFSPDDYVVAALHLYVDIIMIFICLLKLFDE